MTPFPSPSSFGLTLYSEDKAHYIFKSSITGKAIERASILRLTPNANGITSRAAPSSGDTIPNSEKLSMLSPELLSTHSWESKRAPNYRRFS